MISSLLFSSLLISAVSGPVQVLAEDYETKLEQQNQTINTLNEQETENNSELAALQSKVDSINTEAAELLNQQSELRESTAALQSEIETLNTRIEKREVSIQQQARDVQVSGGSLNYLEVILNANSISDAITRLQGLTTFVKANNDLVAQQKSDKEAVEAKKSKNEAQLQTLQENQATLEAQKGQLAQVEADLKLAQTELAIQKATAEDEKTSLLAQKAEAEAEKERVLAEERLVEEQRQTLAAVTQQTEPAASTESAVSSAAIEESVKTVDSSDSAVSSVEPDLSAANTTIDSGTTITSSEEPVITEPPVSNNVGDTGTTTVPNNNTTPAAPVVTAPSVEVPIVPAPSANGSSILAEAYKHIGKPYVYGAKGPNSFDCSGFTRYVYLQVTGRDIGSYTVPQESAGTVIPVSQAQAGDLLFWGSAGNTYHVAISTGGNGYIHAPVPGQTVTTATISAYFAPSFAVRVS